MTKDIHFRKIVLTGELMKLKATGLFIILILASQAYAAGPTGKRKVASYWQESNAFLAVTGDVVFDNPDSCTKSDKVILPTSHMSYKQFLATVMLAKSVGGSFTAYASGCYTAWGNTYPNIYAIGLE